MKPLGMKGYGSIGHLPGSRRGPGDHGVNDGQARICCERTRDSKDVVIVQEKLDGSNVCVARIDGQLLAINRAGYLCQSAPHEQHRLFADWVRKHEHLFRWLKDGQRVVGEWLAMAHGTRYDLIGRSPFVAFDVMEGQVRLSYSDFRAAIDGKLVIAPLLFHARGLACSVGHVMNLLAERGRYGALDEPEGAVWRVERDGNVDFLAKYVRPGKVDGKYFARITGDEEVWNWRPDHA